MLLHIPLLLLMLVAVQQSQPVQPLLSCWFHSYSGGERIFNLVMSYNNTDLEEQMLPLVLGENTITPSAYDGLQPDLYLPGLHQFEFVITDTQQSGTISWLLGNITLVIETGQLDETTRCNQAFQGVCPGKIMGFCEDSIYCNGQEFCFSGNFFLTSSMGVCTSTAQGVQCPAQQECHETNPVGCVDTQAPTQAPTAPTLAPTTLAPTDAPTAATEAPTPAPTAPTGAPTYETIDIAIHPNCWFTGRINATFRNPLMQIAFDYNNPTTQTILRPITQTTARGRANLLTPAYNGQQPEEFLPGLHQKAFTLVDYEHLLEMGAPVSWYLGKLLYVIDPVNLTHLPRCHRSPFTLAQCSLLHQDCSTQDSFCHGESTCDLSQGQCTYQEQEFGPCGPVRTEGSLLTMNCVEEMQICAQVVECETDQQCNDDLLCNGQEQCINGTCTSQEDFSCGSDAFVCIEGQGCVALQQYALTNGAIVAVVIAIALFILVIIAIVLGYLYFNRDKAEKKNKRK